MRAARTLQKDSEKGTLCCAHYSSLSARTSTLGTQFIGEVRLTAREVRAPRFGAHMAVRALQLQAHHSISVVCGARITVYEVRAPQFGARVTAREVRALQLQARHSISVVCGARITVREVRAPQLPACNSLVRRA